MLPRCFSCSAWGRSTTVSKNKIKLKLDRFSTLSLTKEDSLKLQDIKNLFDSSKQDNISGDEDLKLQKHLSYFKLLKTVLLFRTKQQPFHLDDNLRNLLVQVLHHKSNNFLEAVVEHDSIL